MLKHDVRTIAEDEHTLTFDQSEVETVIKGVVLRKLGVDDGDPNVIVGTPSIQVIDGSVAAVLKVVVKHASASAPAAEMPADQGSVPLTDAPAEPAGVSVSVPAVQPVSRFEPAQAAAQG